MSYCVHCGVELHPTASQCPLCGTPVLDPGVPERPEGPLPFPTQRREVPPADRRSLALLISAMLASAGVATGVLNLWFFYPRVPWSLYIIGACAMLWLVFVPPLWWRGMYRLLRLLVDIGAVALYLLLIALALDGMTTWYLGLALPIVLLIGAFGLFLTLTLGGQRSILSTITLCIGSVGLFCVGLELLICRYLSGVYSASWSIIVLVISAALIIPLLVVRRHPALREEARRRFHI